MLLTALAQLRCADSLLFGIRFARWSLDRLIAAMRETMREFGHWGPSLPRFSALVLHGSRPCSPHVDTNQRLFAFVQGPRGPDMVAICTTLSHVRVLLAEGRAARAVLVLILPPPG